MKRNDKTVSIFELGRKDIRALLYEDERGNVITIYNNKKINKILEDNKIENPIIIYNPTLKIQEEIKKMLMKNIVDKNNTKETQMEINIDGEEYLKTILKMVTNINLGLDEDTEENKDMIREILADPSDILKATSRIVLDIFKSIGEELKGAFTDISKMSQDEMELYVKRYKKEVNNKMVEETEEEKLTREYEEKMKELKMNKQKESDNNALSK